MSCVISWDGELNDEQKEALNDALNLLGMQEAANRGLIPQSDVDAEVERITMKK